MQIKEIMTKPVIGASPDLAIKEAIKLMADKQVSCLLVCEDNQLHGVFTEREVTRCIASPDDLLNQPLRNVVNQNPPCLQETTDLWDALKLANSRKLKHFPIQNREGRVTGVITQTDIVKTALQMAAEVENLRNTVAELSLLCSEDHLLNIPNRRAMEEEMRFLHSFSRRHDTVYAICLIDVDHFKDFNDFYGHQAGDEALKSISDTLNKNMRDSDRIFRYGGEEFLITMQGTNLQQALIGAERLLESINRLSYPHKKSPLGFLSISIGLADSSLGHNEELISCADKALYTAKKEGKNCVRTYR